MSLISKKIHINKKIQIVIRILEIVSLLQLKNAFPMVLLKVLPLYFTSGLLSVSYI